MSSLAKIWQASWDGFRNRCPECKRGQIWGKDGEIHKQCSECGLIFEPDEVDWGGFSWAYSVEGTVLFIGGAISILLEMTVLNLPWTVYAYFWTAFVILFHLLFYRNLKGQWVGMRTAMMGRPGSRV